MKTCSSCRKSKPHSKFYPNYKTTERNPINPCKECKGSRKQDQFTRSPEAFMRRMFSSLRSNRTVREEKRMIDWELTLDQLIEMYHTQDGRCAMTGILMTHQRAADQKNPYNISIDRLEITGPYSIENIQLVCKIVNLTRQSLSVSDYVNLCCNIADFNREA